MLYRFIAGDYLILVSVAVNATQQSEFIPIVIEFSTRHFAGQQNAWSKNIVSAAADFARLNIDLG